MAQGAIRDGNLKRASELCSAILRVNPTHFAALKMLGELSLSAGRQAAAADYLSQALSVRPNAPNVLFMLGLALMYQGKNNKALACFERAVRIKPDFTSALNNRGVILLGQLRVGDALQSFDSALAINPDMLDALNNRGRALHELQRYDEALACYERALKIKPDFSDALTNLGRTLHNLNRLDEAMAANKQALALNPDDSVAHTNLGLINLTLGDFEAGWRQYEWRWSNPTWTTRPRKFDKPAWLGADDIQGKTVFLYAEQGFGDTLQFCRYAPLVEALGATAILEVQPALKPLLAGLAHRVIAAGEPIPPHDFTCPLLSLPLAFGTLVDTIPSTVPYITASDELRRLWSERLGPRSRPRVGIVFSGRPSHQNDMNRSVALKDLDPLIKCNAQFTVLQNALRPHDAATLTEHPDILHFCDQINSFADTAAMVSLMDLVISVDTSAAHLAAAMGRPAWILIPSVSDWRWMTGRDDSPWYPSARLFRQPAIGQWEGVIRDIACELRAFILDHQRGG